MLVEEVGDARLREAAQDADHLRLLRALNPISAIAVPMLLRGRALGVITLVNADSGRRFDAHDLPLAEDLAARAATAVDNARLYRTRSAIAQTLQASLLPPHLPEIEGVESAARYRAAGEGAEVGGDFYDLFSVADGHWIAVIGDVCGKGAAAAAVTALARYTIRTAAVRRRSPAAILRWVSDAMVRHDPQDGRFCTIACVHLETDRTPVRITVACGGHPLPLILRADGSVAEAGGSGTLLGLVEDPDVQDHEAQLQPGDTLVLYTDGLTEAHAPQHVWSADDLASALRGAAGDGPAGVLDHLEAAALGPDGAARATTSRCWRCAPWSDVSGGGRPLAGALDLAAPLAGLAAAALDHLLEAVEVALDPPLGDAQRVAGLLDDALGLGVELDHHARLVVVEAVEGDDAGVVRAARGAPGHPLVGLLLGDLGVELALDPGDLRLPVQPAIIELADLLDALHEARERLELRPLVVDGVQRDADVDALFDRGHGNLRGLEQRVEGWLPTSCRPERPRGRHLGRGGGAAAWSAGGRVAGRGAVVVAGTVVVIVLRPLAGALALAVLLGDHLARLLLGISGL